MAMKVRIKMGQLPGDVPRAVKIAMLEGRHPDRRRSKAFRRSIRGRERAVLRQRLRQMLEEI